jgi:hypothetical protein
VTPAFDGDVPGSGMARKGRAAHGKIAGVPHCCARDGQDGRRLQYHQQLYGLHLVLMSQSAARKVEEGDRFRRIVWVSTEMLHRAQCALGTAIGIWRAAAPVPGQLG